MPGSEICSWPLACLELAYDKAVFADYFYPAMDNDVGLLLLLMHHDQLRYLYNGNFLQSLPVYLMQSSIFIISV